MRIGIDGRELYAHKRGIGRYVWELCRELDRRLPEAEFIVYSRDPIELPVVSGGWRLRSDESFLGSRLSALLWLKLRCGTLCREDRLDAFWGTAVFLPRLERDVRTVVTVHDLCHRLTPETFDPLHLRGVRLFFASDVRRADVVLTISRGTADRLRQHVGREADGVAAPGISPEFRRPETATIERCRERYGLVGPYILTVAAWEPRKNLKCLVEAFVELRRRERFAGHRLVLVGKQKGQGVVGVDDSLERYRNAGVVALGYVPDSDLPALYAGADVFVLASFYEGFGMPVLEARACGTRVVATDIPELREAGGREVVYIEPTREGIINGIVRALDLPPSRVRDDPVPEWSVAGRVVAAALDPDGAR